MRTLQLTAIAILASLLFSCGGGIAKAPATAVGFETIEAALKSKFGNNAYYTDLNIMNADPIGNMVNVTVTDQPESLQMGEWSNAQGVWNQTAELSLEISEGSTAAEFMFQLDDKIKLKKLGELVEQSMEHLEAEKDLKNPSFSMAYVNYPDNGDVTEARYIITLEPEHGGTSFSYTYKLDGEFLGMDY